MYDDNDLTNRFRIGFWKRPLFRTVIALVTLVIIHALLLKIKEPGAGLTDWLKVWTNLLRGYAGVGIVALGMTFVITSGGVDLSAGATAAAAAAVIVLFADTGKHGILHMLGLTGVTACAAAVCAGLIFGALLGFLSGVLITRGNIPPYLATLGTMLLFRSLAGQALNGVTPVIPAEFGRIALHQVWGAAYLPIIYWLILAVISWIILNRTIFGKYTAASGSSEKAAWLAGINVRRIRRLTYVIAGIAAAVAAIILVSTGGKPDYANAGSGYATDAITACILGGCKLGGGSGNIAGAVMGTLIVAVINNLPGLADISPYISEACKGAVIIAAVLYQGKKNTFYR